MWVVIHLLLPYGLLFYMHWMLMMTRSHKGVFIYYIAPKACG